MYYASALASGPKFWHAKIWWSSVHSPNSPKFTPSNIFRYTVSEAFCTIKAQNFFVSQSDARFEIFCIREWQNFLYHRAIVTQGLKLFALQSDTGFEAFYITEWSKAWNFLYHRVTQGLKHFVHCKLKETEYMYLTDNTWPLPPHNMTLLTLSVKVSDVFALFLTREEAEGRSWEYTVVSVDEINNSFIFDVL